jgi:hypothetical protein
MKKARAFPKRWRSIGLTFGILCVALLALSRWLPNTKSDSQKDFLPKIKNETESFRLVSAEKNGAVLVLKMRNVSSKGITAYSISTRPGSREDTDYSLSGHVIAPGDIEETEISSASLYTINSSNQPKPMIRILAVVFDDRTSEGDFGVATIIKDTRLGKKMQLKRINRLIRETLQSSNTSSFHNLSSLKSRIAALSEETEQGEFFSPAVRSGLHSAKEDVLTLIGQLEQNENTQSSHSLSENDISLSLREGLNKLAVKSEEWINRY